MKLKSFHERYKQQTTSATGPDAADGAGWRPPAPQANHGRPAAQPDAAGDQPRLDQAARHSGRSPVRSPRQRRAADAARARARSASGAGAGNLAGGLAAGPPL